MKKLLSACTLVLMVAMSAMTASAGPPGANASPTNPAPPGSGSEGPTTATIEMTPDGGTASDALVVTSGPQENPPPYAIGQSVRFGGTTFVRHFTEELLYVAEDGATLIFYNDGTYTLMVPLPPPLQGPPTPSYGTWKPKKK